jgi:predicted transglutaminase-like cysteine proteinase
MGFKRLIAWLVVTVPCLLMAGGTPVSSALIEKFEAMFDEASELSESEKLKYVNDFFNSNIRFINDQALWKTKDYWATPYESLQRRAGDCEDYSLAKYFSLVKAGVPPEKLRIMYVKAVELRQAHMVLTYYSEPSAMPVVLDNLIGEIKPANQRKDLVPVYSFNATGFWLNKMSGKTIKLGNASRVSMWSEFIDRMAENDPLELLKYPQ